MCRIAGVANPSLSAASLQDIVKSMCTILRHGGPDDEGIHICEGHHLAFGHRRLSIIDLSEAGHQPMAYANGRYYITYNGELYNYLELKEELEKAGYAFKTKCDTEVILASFAAWGTKAFARFNGMFAFALLDNADAMLYLVRDPSGIKPLYYAITGQGIAFASEVRAFKPIPYLQEAEGNWQVYLMAYGHLPEPITTLKKVQPLEKGCFLKYHLPTSISDTETFSQHTYIEKISSRNEAIDKIKATLHDAVRRNLLSDAPIGVFLSGGLDSSILAMLANKADGSQLNTLSLFFEESDYSEKKYQDFLQEQLLCKQHQYLLKEEEFHKYLPTIFDAMDLPSCDGINTWFISKYAKENGLKAVLSGIGADELYGGYPSFDRMRIALLLAKLPGSILRKSKYSSIKKIHRAAYLSIDSAVGKYLFLRGQFMPDEIAKHLGMDEAEVWKILEEQPQLSDIGYLTPANQAAWMETNLYMQNQLLRDADVMSMAHGVEIRVPFLDKEFVDLSLQIRSKVKYAGPKKKQLLIDSFKSIVPEVIWDRPKMGFGFPFKEWLVNDEYAKDKTAAYQEFVSGKMHWSKFLTLMLMEGRKDG